MDRTHYHCERRCLGVDFCGRPGHEKEITLFQTIMAAFILAYIEVQNPEDYQEYIKQVPALVAKHGGVYRARGGECTVREGSWQPKRTVLLEFPDRASAEAFYDDPEYAPVMAIRHRTSNTNLIIFDGL